MRHTVGKIEKGLCKAIADLYCCCMVVSKSDRASAKCSSVKIFSVHGEWT